MGKVFVQIQGIHLAELFGGDVDLPTEECGDSRFADAHLEIYNLCLRFLLDETIQRRGPPPRQPLLQPTAPEVSPDQVPRVGGIHARVKHTRLARLDDLDHGGAVAHSHATDALDFHNRAGLSDAFAQRVIELVTAFGHAAGTQADVNLRGRFLGRVQFFSGSTTASGLERCS